MTGSGTVLRVAAGLLAGAGVLALSGCTAPDDASPVPSPSATHALSPTDPVAYAALLVSETATARLDDGKAALVGSECAQAAALTRATDLVGVPELTHASLTGAIADCAPATKAAENLSRAAATPAEIVAAWMGSAGHRSNLLDPELTEIGVGCVLDGDEMLCSQVFLGP